MNYDLSNMTFFQKIRLLLFGFRLVYRAYVCATRVDCEPQYCKYCDSKSNDKCVCHSASAMELASLLNDEYVRCVGKFRSSERK